MNRTFAISSCMLCLLALVACESDEPEFLPQMELTAPDTLIGVLRGDVMAIGGETTGWVLEGQREAGGIQLDVSAVRDKARQLEGQLVMVKGKMQQVDYVETGRTPVLVVSSIAPAPKPQNVFGEEQQPNQD